MKKLFVAAALATALTSCSLTLPVKAAQNGGITKISTVDIKHKSILGIVVSYETIVTGE